MRITGQLWSDTTMIDLFLYADDFEPYARTRLKGKAVRNIYTHNHPNNGVFSWGDLETARGFDMAGIRDALSNGATLSIKRNQTDGIGILWIHN